MFAIGLRYEHSAAVEKAKGPTRRRLAADLVAVEADWLGTRAA